MSFIRGHLGCLCNREILWVEKYLKFLEICKIKMVTLLDTEEEYLKNTEKNGAKTKLKLQCNKCCKIVTTTTIDNFINLDQLNCFCINSKSEKCLGELLEEIFPNNQFNKIRPDWIKNKEGNKLELDFYCEELNLALEYQGLQHEEYVPYFHNNDINNFYKQQEHDRIKKEICEKKGIKLICIPSCYNFTDPIAMTDYVLDNL